ncbi:MAG TPA: amidase [Geminicoccaceae bacterium]|nr:amidase [Geminicoccus sp.]HMU51740.1 amidase [Geminicoccaceae bacterium]
MAMDLADRSAADLLRLYRQRRASPVEAVEACLARIERLDATFGAFCLVDGEGAKRAAKASEARWLAGRPQGLLDGVPTTIKDLVVVEGWPTRRGSLTTEADPPAAADAPAVARLRAHGAVLLGKTTTPEFGWKAVTDNPRGEVARNPWNREMTPGGSSGGAAVAAALGMGALHIGTDGGGSIRIPAGLSGIVGIKPTFGRVAAWPASPFGTVAHLGPMTRTVTDAALMLTAMSGPDSRDWLALPDSGTDLRTGLDGGVAGLRIAFSPDLGYARVDPEVEAAVARAADLLAELDAVVERRDPGFESPWRIFERIWFPGAALVVDSIPADRRELLDPGLRRVAETGRRMSALDVQRAAYDRADLAIRMQRFFDEVDLLVTPTLPITAFPVGREHPLTNAEWVEWTPFSYPFNLTQQPAITVPCGLSSAGLPIGVQIVGPKYADALVLRAARALESAFPFAMPAPTVD